MIDRRIGLLLAIVFASSVATGTMPGGQNQIKPDQSELVLLRTDWFRCRW